MVMEGYSTSPGPPVIYAGSPSTHDTALSPALPVFPLGGVIVSHAGPPTLASSDNEIQQESESASKGTSFTQQYTTIAAQRTVLDEATERRFVEEERRKAEERLLPGLDDPDLMAMHRAFDKQVQHVRVAPPPYDAHIPKGLDIQPSPDEEFTVDKLRCTLERFYSSVLVGVIRTVTEVERIRSWGEGGERTAVALFVYAYAWWCNLIMTTFLSFLSILILFPSVRAFCFDPPRYTPSGTIEDNSLAYPMGIVPSKCSAIADSRRSESWGPAATADKANHWADTVMDLLQALVVPGKDQGKQAEKVQEELKGKADEMMKEDMKKKEASGQKAEGEGQGEKKMDKAIELYAQPGMRILAGLADKWERLANSLSPTPPFVLHPHRVAVFAYLAVPLLVVSTFVSERMFSRTCGVVFGFLLFGQPLVSHVLAELERIDPQWLQRVLLEHNILAEVPTNTQLCFRLLREAEHARHPLPAPQSTELDKKDPSDGPDDGSSDDDSGTEEESNEGDGKLSRVATKTTKRLGRTTRAKLRGAWDRVGTIKEEGFAMLTGHKKVDYRGKAEKTMAKLHLSDQSKPAKGVLRQLPDSDADSAEEPARFYVHHPKHGPGHIIIYPPTVPAAGQEYTPARITFTTIRNSNSVENAALADNESGVTSDSRLTISINDIIGLKKEGLSWPTRIIASLLLDDTEAGGTGLAIDFIRHTAAQALDVGIGDTKYEREGETAGDTDETYTRRSMDAVTETVHFKGIVRRNELFDRLLTIGEQRWEMM